MSEHVKAAVAAAGGGAAMSVLCQGVDRLVTALRLGLIMTAAIACRPSGAAEPSNPRTSAEPPVRVTFTAPLAFETSSAHKSHAPMVRGALEGFTTWLIVDTGASDPVFTRSTATRAGVPLVPADAGTDHAGASVGTWTSPDALVIGIGDRTLRFERPLVIEGPPQLEKLGIGGFLSPQGLDPRASLILDLRRDELRWVEGPLSEIDRDISAQHGELTRLSLPRAESPGDGQRLLLVRGSLGSSAPIRVLLNSGGSDIEVSPRVLPAGPAREERVTGRGLSGAPVQGYVTDGPRLTLEGTALPMSSVVVRDQGPHFDAQIGMGMLRGTIVVISADRNDPILWWVALPEPGAGSVVAAHEEPAL